MIQSLDLPIRLDKKSRRATGWIFAESQTLTIERDSNTVQIVNNDRPLQPGELYDSPEGWCVDTDTLAGWFGVSLTVDLRNSLLVLDSERPLPFIEAIERKSRAARLRPEQDARPERLSARAAALRAVAHAVGRRGRPGRLSRGTGRRHGSTRRYEVFASGEVALASFDMRLASDSQGVPESLRLRAFRMDPEAACSGRCGRRRSSPATSRCPRATSPAAPASAAACSSATPRSTGRPGSARTILRGTLPLGWDAELYRNGQLLGYQSDSLDGRYEFEVPLVYGNNDLEVVLYGPQGQIRREAQSIPVGQGAVAPGKLEYWTGIVERNRDLVTFGQPPPG